MDIDLDLLDEYTEVTVKLNHYQLAILDLAFAGESVEEALETAWMMVSERVLSNKKAALEALDSPSVTAEAIAHIDTLEQILMSSRPEGCPCFPD